MARPLERTWFERDAPVVAPDLLNKLIVVTVGGATCSGRIIETEAYMPDDPASHTFNGETARNAVMFGPAGHLYVYLSYGIHHCVNVVTGVEGEGQAVLLRAIEPVDGIPAMRERRAGRPDRELANGPGKLAAALGVVLRFDGADMVGEAATHDRLLAVAIVDDGVAAPKRPIVGPRIGISKATAMPWRFRVPCPT